MIDTVDVPVSGIHGPRREPRQHLGKDDFLLLLTKQLQHQDPFEPVSNMEFVSQMANFSTLEQITNMTKALEQVLSGNRENYKMEAMSFLGKKVIAQRPDMAEPVAGTVDSVVFVDGQAVFMVGGHDVNLEHIQLVQS